jgi:hypothetical protein
MKHYKILGLITVGTALSFLSFVLQGIQAQIPPEPASEMDGTNIDELPDDPQQMRIWRCTQADKTIVVEAKDVPIWKEMIEGDGWQCTEELSFIPANERKFSCEPSEIIGILTVFWLEGKGGQQQLQDWMDRLNKQQGMICTMDKTSPYFD